MILKVLYSRERIAENRQMREKESDILELPVL